MKIETIKKHLESLTPIFGFNPMEVEQGSKEWFTMKLGVFSATGAAALTSKGKGGKPSATRSTYLAQKVAEVCTCMYAEASSKQMEWGHEQEDKARAAYEWTTGKKVEELPLIFKPDSDNRIAISPDAYGDIDALEIKAPWTSQVHIEFLVYGKIKSEYTKQVQFSMWVTDREFWDFASYDPRMNVRPFHVQRINRDDKIIAEFEKAIPEAIAEMDEMLSVMGIKFGDHWKKIKEENNAL